MLASSIVYTLSSTYPNESAWIAQGDQLGALWPPMGWDRVLCGHLGGGIGRVRGRCKREGIWGYICIHIADSLCYKAEPNTPL